MYLDNTERIPTDMDIYHALKDLEGENKMQITDTFKGKILVITGGTGSFGSTVLKHFLQSGLSEIRIISRDEKKQDWMRHTLQAQYPKYANKVQFYIGDVRNLDSVRDVMYGANFVFHAAALKEVPSCEFSRWRPLELISSVLTT